MARKKINKFLSVFTVFFKSINTFFLYLDKTSKYLFLPIFGQILGLGLILIITYYFNINADSLMKISFFSTGNNLLFAFLLALLPFLALFLYSFYSYIIAFCALNIVFFTLSNKKKVKEIDFKSNNKVIERKIFQYALLMLIVSVLCLFPLLWIGLCLCFQAFALEGNINCIKAISRSIELTMENLIAVIVMLILAFIFSYCFLPALFIWGLEKISAVDFLVTRLEVYFQLLPYNEVNRVLEVVHQHIDSVTIAKFVVESILTFIIIGFTLPFRCAYFTEMYRLFDNSKIKEISKEDEEIIKRATKKSRKNNK